MISQHAITRREIYALRHQRGYTCRCSCGYSVTRSTIARAENDLDDHICYMAMIGVREVHRPA